MNPDKPIPTWTKVLVSLYAVAWVLFVALDWHRFVADFYPIDRSNVGPNLAASVVQYTILAITLVLVWPPTRRRIHRFVDAKVGDVRNHIDGHVRVLHDRHDGHADELAELRHRLDHLLHHTGAIETLPPRPTGPEKDQPAG